MISGEDNDSNSPTNALIFQLNASDLVNRKQGWLFWGRGRLESNLLSAFYRVLNHLVQSQCDNAITDFYSGLKKNLFCVET